MSHVLNNKEKVVSVNTSAAFSDFGSRLRVLMKDRNVSAFARSCDVTEGTIRNYLKNQSDPKLKNLIAIARAGNVNINWLAVGKGPMRPDDEKEEYAGHGFSADDIYDVAKTAAQFWQQQSLPQPSLERWAAVLRYLCRMIQKEQAQRPDVRTAEIAVDVLGRRSVLDAFKLLE